MHGILLGAKGTTRNAKISAEDTTASVALVSKLLRRATNPETIGIWKWSGYMLHLYGYKTGKAGTENKHELPPPHDTILLFGDAMILATKSGMLVDFGTTEYTRFYNDGHGGFEDLDSEDSETGDEEEDEEEGEAEEEETEDETESEEESIPDAEVEEEEEERPAPRKVVAAPKAAKRAGKKIPTWYTIPELVPEPYKLVAKKTGV